jgi:hypothetical protein
MERKRRKLGVLAIMVGIGSLITPAAGAAEAAFSKPALMTSVGQSSDIAVLKALLNTKLQLGIDSKAVAAAADLAGIKSLLIVVGSSIKGLGAAGLDTDKETQRAKALLQACKEQGIKILLLHTGGEARRGENTQDFIQLLAPAAAQVVVIASGNKDKLFNSAAGASGPPVVEVDSLAAAGEAVKGLFK